MGWIWGERERTGYFLTGSQFLDRPIFPYLHPELPFLWAKRIKLLASSIIVEIYIIN